MTCSHSDPFKSAVRKKSDFPRAQTVFGVSVTELTMLPVAPREDLPKTVNAKSMLPAASNIYNWHSAEWCGSNRLWTIAVLCVTVAQLAKNASSPSV